MPGGTPPLLVVLDTNILVAAGFNPRSHSARIVAEIELGRLRMIWNDQTRSEIEHIVNKIPPLAHISFRHLFREENRYGGDTNPEDFRYVADPDDRKFAALAAAAGATLVTVDEHLLVTRERGLVSILTPRELIDAARPGTATDRAGHPQS